jgi:transposase
MNEACCPFTEGVQGGKRQSHAGTSVREASARLGVSNRCVYKYRKAKGLAQRTKEAR